MSVQVSRRVRTRCPEQVVAERRGLAVARLFFLTTIGVTQRNHGAARRDARGERRGPRPRPTRAEAALGRGVDALPDDALLCLLRCAGCQMVMLGIEAAPRRFCSGPAIVSSGLAGAPAHLPDPVRATRAGALRMLPAFVRAARLRNDDEIPVPVRAALPEAVAARLSDALWIPALRAGAGLQLRAWALQSLLARLEKATPRGDVSMVLR